MQLPSIPNRGARVKNEALEQSLASQSVCQHQHRWVLGGSWDLSSGLGVPLAKAAWELTFEYCSLGCEESECYKTRFHLCLCQAGSRGSYFCSKMGRIFSIASTRGHIQHSTCCMPVPGQLGQGSWRGSSCEAIRRPAILLRVA